MPATLALRSYALPDRVWVNGYVAFMTTFLFLDTRTQRNLYYVLAALVIVPLWRERRRIEALRSPIVAVAVLYLAWLAASAAWADGASLLMVLDELRRLLMLLLFLAVTLLVAERAPDIPVAVFSWLGWLAGPLAAAAILLYAAGELDFEDRLIGFGRTAHPVIGATIYGVVALGVWYGALPHSEPGWRKLLLWFGFAMSVAFVAVSQSRGAMLALLAALALVALLRRRTAVLAALVVLPLAAVAVLAAGWLDAGTLIDRGANNRFAIWAQVLDRIAAEPWFGAGVSTRFAFPMTTHVEHHPHNILLAAQLHGGVPALALLLLLLALAIRAAWREFREQGDVLLLALLTFALVCGMFDYRIVPANVDQEWLSFWFPVALLAARRRSGARAA